MNTIRFFKACLLVAAFFGMVTFSCCDGSEPDACIDVEEVKAKFTFGQQLPMIDGSAPDTVVVSDTVLTWKTIVFEASEDYDSYEWTVGDDPRTFNEKRFTLRFENPETSIQVKLKVTKSPNNKCFPDDDGEDTLIKTLTVIDRSTSPIAGTYVGSLTNSPNDQFEVTVSNLGNGVYKISNLIKGCLPSYNQFSEFPAYKTLGFDGDGDLTNNCNDETGYLTLAPNGKDVTIDFSILIDPFPSRRNLKFQGRRK